MELVGRDGELAAVRRWLAGRLSPQPDGPPVLLVSGEAGVGKTALVEAVLAEYGTLAGRGAGSPWYPAAFGVLRSAVPGWNGVPEPAEVRKAMPAVLFLEDLQWSDDASLELLAALAEAIAGDPVAVVGAYRGDELPRTHLLRRVRAGLRHARCLTEVPLRPLDPDSVTRLVAGLLGAEPVPALATVVSTRTEGMPFFVAELVAALRDAGRLVPDGGRVGLAEAPRLPVPDTVRDAVLLRVSRLPEQARATLDAAALVGADFDVDTVLALVGSDAWPDELDHSGLIALADNGSGRFRHALAQEAVYDDIPWSRRRALHLALADRLSARGAAALLVAAHLLAGHDNDRARPALLAAADDQMRVHAYSDAARLLRQALELWPLGVEDHARLAATDRLARCAELTGEHTEAISLLRELIDGQPDRAPAPVHRRMALQLELVGQWPAALAARETAAAAFASAGDPGEAAIDRLAAAAHLRSAGGFRAALEVLAVARVDASRAGRLDLQARVEGLRGNVLCRMGRADEGVPSVRAALDLALSNGLTGPAAELYQRLADSLEHASDYRSAAQAYDSAYAFCEAHGDQATGLLCQACAAVVMFHSGRWNRAVRLCREVLDDEAARPHPRAAAAAVLGLVHALRGQAGPARAALLESRSTAARIELVAAEILALWGLAMAEDLAGNSDGAAEEYRRVVRRCEETEESHYCVPVLLFAAAHFAERSASKDLSAVTAVLARIAEATGQPEARAALAYALASGATADVALDHYRRALDLLSGLELPIVDSQIRWRTGVVLLATGDRVGGADSLRQAYRTLHRLGARPLADRIRATLGEPDADRPALRLTGRETQVLGLVADGHTSREIARRLYLSTRTVEMHVQNAMTKLGCRTRAEAVHLLGRATP